MTCWAGGGVLVTVGNGTGVRVGMRVCTGNFADCGVCVGVLVLVTVIVGVALGTNVIDGVSVGVAVAVNVTVGVTVAVIVSVDVAVAVKVALGLAVSMIVGLGAMVGNPVKPCDVWIIRIVSRVIKSNASKKTTTISNIVRLREFLLDWRTGRARPALCASARFTRSRAAKNAARLASSCCSIKASLVLSSSMRSPSGAGINYHSPRDLST